MSHPLRPPLGITASLVIVIVVLGLLFVCMPFAKTQAAEKYTDRQTIDPHIVFDEPKPGQIFAPGDTVVVTVHVLPPLKEQATDALITASISGIFPAQKVDWPNRVFRWAFPIPKEFSGPITISALIVAGEDPAHPGQPQMVESPPVTVVVHSKEPPDSISLLEHRYLPGCCGPKTEQLYVKGDYAGVQRDITAAEAGTMYHSSNPAVADVDENGSVRILGEGIAAITAENGGAKDVASFVVEDPEHPLPPQDMAAQVQITKSVPSLDPEAKAYGTYPLMVQTITVTNISDQPVPGPLYLKVRGLPDSRLPNSVSLWEKIWNAPANPPPNENLYSRRPTDGSTPVAIRLTPKHGLPLMPGEQISQQVYFLLSGKEAVVPDVGFSLIRSSTPP